MLMQLATIRPMTCLRRQSRRDHIYIFTKCTIRMSKVNNSKTIIQLNRLGKASSINPSSRNKP